MSNQTILNFMLIDEVFKNIRTNNKKYDKKTKAGIKRTYDEYQQELRKTFFNK